MKKIYKIIILIIGLFTFNNTFAFNSLDNYLKYGELTIGNTNTINFGTGQELFIKNIQIINLNNTGTVNVSIYDDLNLIYKNNISNDYTIGINGIIHNNLKIINNGSNNFGYFINGFYIKKGSDVKYNGTTEKDTEKRIIDTIILIIFVLFLWKIGLNISYYFRK